MKKMISVIVVGMAFLATATPQVPYGFNYQAIARNGDGKAMTNQPLEVVVRIRSGSETGTVVWQEEQAAETDAQGLFNLVLCSGSEFRTGGTALTVGDINWGSEPHFLDIRIDAGQGWEDLGVSRIGSVPYSLVSGQSITGAQKLEIMPDEPLGQGEALFIVKRDDGYPVFAVYEDGVWVYTDTAESGKAIKGGFAVGGYRTGNKGVAREFFRVTPDSTKIFVNEDPLKGIKGGFAVGGYQTGKASGTREFLRVTPDSTRVYVNSSPGKGIKGGFAVGGYQTGKAADGIFMSLEKENYFIGHNSGSRITTGLYNSVIGYESGLNITEGGSNAFLGFQSGYNNTTGTGNLFLGYQTGYSNQLGDYNTFLGYKAGYLNYQGINNTFLGSFSGQNNIDGGFNTFVGDSTGFSNNFGYSNTFVGTGAGLKNTTGYSNVMVGTRAGYENRNGGFNVFIGHESGRANVDAGSNVYIGTNAGFRSVSGWNNIYMGTRSGYSNVDGEGNVMLGYESGYYNVNGTRNVFIGSWAGRNELGSGKLYINDDDADSTGTLVWGDFLADQLRFNAFVGVGGNPMPGNGLSVTNRFGASSVAIRGIGDAYDFARLLFMADTIHRNSHYSLAYSNSGNFKVGYISEESDYFPRLVIGGDGRVGVNGEPGVESMIVHDRTSPSTFVLRGVGNTYDYSMVRFESEEFAEDLGYSLGFTTSNSFLLQYIENGSNYARLLVDKDGRVAINSWGPATEVLDVNGNARFRGVGAAGSADDLRITADGTLTTSTSDIRLKSNIEPITNSLNRVLMMQGVTFAWKDDPGGSRDAGLIAQQVAPVFPEAVFENNTDGTLGINYSRFSALFVEAIKEQQQLIKAQQNEIDDQKDEIREQQAEIADLRSRIERLEHLLR